MNEYHYFVIGTVKYHACHDWQVALALKPSLHLDMTFATWSTKIK
jgi:hypothetical protein